jgi:hypothetical protein
MPLFNFPKKEPKIESPPEPVPPPQITAPDSRMREVAQKTANLVKDLEPVLDVLGIDKGMRGKIVFNLLVKGKIGGLSGILSGKDNRTHMEKFWDGMMGGAPFILLIYGLLIFTILLHKWGLI